MKKLNSKTFINLLSICSLLGISSLGFADYDESVSGDLSSISTAPTAIAVVEGANIVEGSSVAAPGDRDFFVITLAAGQSIDTITLDSYSSTGGGGGSFFAVAFASSIPDLTGTDVEGGTLIGVSAGTSAGENVLDDLGNASLTGPGFTPPLTGPGDYTFWIQETAGDIDYSFTFNVIEPEAVNVPTLPWFMTILFAIVLSIFAVQRSRKKTW